MCWNGESEWNLWGEKCVLENCASIKNLLLDENNIDVSDLDRHKMLRITPVWLLFVLS